MCRLFMVETFYLARDIKEWFGHRVEVYQKKPKLINGQWQLPGQYTKNEVAMFCVGRFRNVTGVEIPYGECVECKLEIIKEHVA